ncbi:MAG: hypothetical protein ACYDBH_24070 [Acidobacteriaceae bacterium]
MLNCELEGASIVLLGSFNPTIFQPKWLASKDLIRATEGEEAEIQVISPEITSFAADWLTVQVTRNRFFASSTDVGQFETLRDFVVSAFRLLEHTPIEKMGMNRDMHFRMESKDKWNAVGDFLAPKEIWGKFIDKPGMETLVIVGKRPESSATVLRVTVQPSRRVDPGVYVGTNEHHEVEGSNAGQALISILQEHWRGALEYAKLSAAELLEDRRIAN